MRCRTLLQVWWRSQAAAYIIRPNPPTMAAIVALRMNTSMTHVWRNGQPQPNLTMPYPLPPGTVSMHVRHKLPTLQSQPSPNRNHNNMLRQTCTLAPLVHPSCEPADGGALPTY